MQMQETDTTSNHSSSGVSETKFLYSQAERLLEFSMETWFKDEDSSGRHIMETALKQVRTATGTTPTSRHAPEPDFARSKPYPSVELIDSILTWRAQNTGSKYIADLQSVISLPTLEAQWLALRNGQAKEPLRNHYIVSVNYAAWCFIGIKMAETTSGDIHKHLKWSKKFYEQNIIYGLQHMSVADLPTTALFQALLSGTMDRAPCITLGRTSKTTVPQDSISPANGLYELFYNLAEVQDAVVRAVRGPKDTDSYSEHVESLERTVHELKGDLQNFRCISEIDPFWAGEVAATSYAASAIMTSVLQLDSKNPKNSLRRNELLAHARGSLRYLLSVLSRVSPEPEGCAIKLSISWYSLFNTSSLHLCQQLTIVRKLLFYPMNPFFTLYGYMLAHSDFETYLMLSEVTHSLVNTMWDNEPFTELISLLSSLMGLASNMFSGQSGLSQQPKSQAPSIAESLGTARPELLVVDGQMTEEELFSHPIEWNEEEMSLADSLALIVDWDVPGIGRESHSNA
ncbi:hypothetical protein GCG54_00009017 [Colletotrichum gloeosporioides]|uniref:Transcription factor domain-containing protein n=1 Tax=Colletotrichum gloeosporioides TaxID=474922 RepID=A0A8H8WND5_COLGL|nr:uncharacterized protein GCG54_00009017 [Colletotrichum gloeosporioides]KAF3797051.1 hypothetical protein GCG54_00009017 [Colletotrichum gloeosporioides]